MKTITKILGFAIIVLVFTTCKKKVEAPNDEANGKGILYIEVAGKKYLFQQNKGDATSKKQRAKFTNGLFNGPPNFKIYNTDTSISDYKLHRFDIFIESEVDESNVDYHFFGGFGFYFWYKDENSPIYIKRIDYGRLPNPSNEWVSYRIFINKFCYFKINQINKIKGKTYLNFETSFQFTEENNTSISFNSYWKGDILITED